MLYITATILAFYALSLVLIVQEQSLYALLVFDRWLILDGEFWRIITFLLVPPNLGTPIWVLLSLFVAYRIGTNLEYVWGKTLFTLYLLFGIIGAIIAGFIAGFGTTTFIFSSLILAFCYMNPHTTFLLFFILPLKAKHIALITWIAYAWAFIQGGAVQRMAIVFSLINFFLFFGPDVWRTMKQNYNTVRRRKQYQKNWGNQNPWR